MGFFVFGYFLSALKWFFLLAVIWCVNSAYAIDISSDIGAVAVVNAQSGRILYARCADESLYPASTTKIATVLFALDGFHPQMNQKIRASKEALRILPDSEKAKGGYRYYPSYIQEARGTSAGLHVGEELTYEDALYGILLVSGNDAANVVAESLAGSIDDFVNKMNSYLQRIGCTKTHFTNPHGLHHPDHVTTALDLARMTQRALEFPQFRKVVATVEYSPQSNKQKVWRQSNLLIRSGPLHSQYAIGVKTGNHARAKSCLVAAYEKDGRRVIAVFLKCPDRRAMFKEMKKLFDELALEDLITKTYVKPGRVSIEYPIPDLKKSIGCYTTKDLALTFYPSEEPKVSASVCWDDLVLPIRKGDQLGALQLAENGKVINTVPLYAIEDVELPLFMKIRKFITLEIVVISILFMITVSWMLALSRRRS